MRYHSQRRRKVLCRGRKEDAKRALESALGGNAEAFKKWEEDIKRREDAASGGGGGGEGGGFRGRGRGWGGGGGEGGNKKEHDPEARKMLYAVGGVAVFILISTRGAQILALVLNSIYFALRGFKRKPSETAPGEGLPHRGAEASVIKKWGSN